MKLPQDPRPVSNSWFVRFTSHVLFTLPFGNDGRGTAVKTFPIVFMIISIALMVVYDTWYAV